MASKSKGRGKSSEKIAKKPASPSTSASVDLDVRFEAQYDRMIKEMDDRMELLSSSLIDQIRSLFDKHQSHNQNSEYASAFPGQAGVHTVPAPPQPQDESASVRSRERLECEGGTGAQTSDLAHAQGSGVRPLAEAQVAHPPGFMGGIQNVPSGSGGPRGRREHFVDDEYFDDMDHKESFAEAPVDRAFAHLINYIYQRFPHSEPQTAASTALRCDYESFFAIAEPPEPSLKFCGFICVWLRYSKPFATMWRI